MADTAPPVLHPYATEREMYARVEALLMEYAGRVSLVATLGVLELAKARLVSEATP